MNKDELMGKSKEELVEKIVKMKDAMSGGGKCRCMCEECKKCKGYKTDAPEM